MVLNGGIQMVLRQQNRKAIKKERVSTDIPLLFYTLYILITFQ